MPVAPGLASGMGDWPRNSCSISPMWRWVNIAYALTLSLTSPKWRSALGSRPAPDTPLLASTTTSAIRPARASGARARIEVVA